MTANPPPQGEHLGAQARVAALGVAGLVLCVGALSTRHASAAPGDTPVYSNDFSTAAGAEWSAQKLETSPAGQQFLGRFGNDRPTLSLVGLPEHEQLVIALDLYILDSMDGNDTGPDSGEGANPDVFTFFATDLFGDTKLLKNTTFGNRHPQAFPGDYPGDENPPGTGSTGSGNLGYDESTAYRLAFTFEHSDDTLQFTAAANGLDDLDDESWGIDNLAVSATTCPGLVADPNANLVVGTEGNDGALVGTPGDDVICGLGGDDDIEGRGGQDIIYPGGGDDISDGGPQRDEIHDVSGDDQLVGGDGNDLLTDSGAGGPGERNVLDGGPGGDELLAGTAGSPQTNRLEGGEGEDRLGGGPGDDRMLGGEEVDRLIAGGGEDRLLGGPKRDFLDGGPDRDKLLGGGGADDLKGGEDDDLLKGGAGDREDDLDGGEGRDRFFGQNDGDNLFAKDGRIDRVLDGGRGTDFAVFDPKERKKLRSIELP